MSVWNPEPEPVEDVDLSNWRAMMFDSLRDVVLVVTIAAVILWAVWL